MANVQSLSRRAAVFALIAVGIGAGPWPVFSVRAADAVGDRYAIDWDGPIVVQAIDAWVDSERRVTRLTGAVLFDHRQWRLRADSAHIDGALDAPERVEILGEPASMTLRARDQRPEVEVSGRRVEYSRADDRLTIDGGASLVEGRRRFSGERFVYDLKTRRIRSDGPVRLRIEPTPRP